MENYVAELKGGMAATVTPNAYNQEAALLGATVELYIPYAQYRTVSPMVMFTESEVNEVSAVKTEIEKLENLGKNAIIITSPIVRMYFKKMTEDYIKNLIVVSYNEIDSDIELQSVGMVTVE